MEPLRRAVDDIAWAGYASLDERHALQKLWKTLVLVYSEGTRGRLIVYTAGVADEHWDKYQRLRAIQRGMPSELSGVLDPLAEHHSAMFSKYTGIKSAFLAMDVMGALA
jgi:hypothetical protein